MNGSFFRRMAGASAIAVALVAGVAQPAVAQDKLNIVGTVDIFQAPAGPIGNVVIDFLPPAGGGTGTVNAFGPQTGVFAIIPPLLPGTNIDFVFGPLPGTTTPPVPILTIGGFTFTATGFGPGNVPGQPFSLTSSGGTVFATLNVVGTVTGPGIVGTQFFIGGYSTQFPNTTIADLIADIEAGTVIPSSISASFETVSAIPEPSTYALMATGLVGLLGAARLRRRA